MLVIDDSDAMNIIEAGDRHRVVSAEWPFAPDGLLAFRTVCPNASECQRISAPCA